MAFAIHSIAFAPGESIPRVFTCDGNDVSPALAWENPPKGIQSFAMICDDPDAPVGTWVHWVIYNIPATATGLTQAVKTLKVLPDGSAQGKNDFGKMGYGGPCPPSGTPHRYYFKLYALSRKLTLAPGATKKELLKAMEGLVLEKAEVFGTYGR